MLTVEQKQRYHCELNFGGVLWFVQKYLIDLVVVMIVGKRKQIFGLRYNEIYLDQYRDKIQTQNAWKFLDKPFVWPYW